MMSGGSPTQLGYGSGNVPPPEAVEYDSEATEDENENENKIEFFEFKGDSGKGNSSGSGATKTKASGFKVVPASPRKSSGDKAGGKAGKKGGAKDPDATEDEEDPNARKASPRRKSNSPVRRTGKTTPAREPEVSTLTHKRGEKHEKIPEFASEFDDKKRGPDPTVSKEERRKRQRIEAEQRRRDRMKDGIEEIKNIVPDDYLDEFRGDSIRDLSQFSILKAASLYIKEMNERYDLTKVDEIKKHLRGIESENARLEEELRIKQ